MALNRKVHKAHIRIQSLNYSLDGLVGFDLAGKNIGVIGTGAIGSRNVEIMNGFDCKVLPASDALPLSKESKIVALSAKNLIDFW